MASYVPTTLVLVLAMLSFLVEASKRKELFNDTNEPIVSNGSVGKKWAVLVAGSSAYGNYRHQADVCHAYQVLRKGGVKDENIIVFMYDDIAFNKDNPRPGIIINKPHGENVYQGVPKDYTGNNVNVANFFAVILGNKTALTGGSGKVVDSGPNDHIFIYYSDHGSPGTLGMPNEYLYAKDLIEVLKKKHDAKSYQRMVLYVEACESGSIFEGLLPENLDIYVATAANANESSYGTYCPGGYPDVAPEYDVCLGDMFSVSWIEDSEIHDLSKETLEQQYQAVRRRTAYEDLGYGPGIHSHVMQYGAKELSNDFLVSYIGNNPTNIDNISHNQNDFMIPSSSISTRAVSQRDADLLHFFYKFQQAPEGSSKKVEAQKQLNDALSNRLHVDQNMNRITRLLFGSENSLAVLQSTIRPKGQPLVDDWDCFKLLVRIYEEKCGSISRYGRKYMRAIANMCNAKINAEQMALVSAQVCGRSSLPWF